MTEKNSTDHGQITPHGNPENWPDVNRWRKSERARLLALRKSQPVANRKDIDAALIVGLRKALHEWAGLVEGKVVSFYWPIKGEPDLRPLMAELHHAGVDIALPLVETKAAPLVFRRWTPDTRMVRGDWNIPVPPPEAEILVPDVALAPLVGWDAACFRLGYGGGYFDRTLAALAPRPFTIGIGIAAAQLTTIFPQPHDFVLDVILTETGSKTRSR